MIHATLLVLSVVGSQVTLELSADKPVYRPGEKVKYSMRLHNGTAKPVVALLPSRDGALAPSCYVTLTSGGREVTYIPDVHAPAQVMVTYTVDESMFVTIPPGKAVTIDKDSFSKQWVLTGSPYLKSSYQKAKTAPLAPGEYTMSGEYFFAKPRGDDPMWNEARLKFMGGSRKLYEEAIQLKLTAKARFNVR